MIDTRQPYKKTTIFADLIKKIAHFKGKQDLLNLKHLLFAASGVLEGGASGAMAPQGRRTKKFFFSSLRFFYRGSQKVQAPE